MISRDEAKQYVERVAAELVAVQPMPLEPWNVFHASWELGRIGAAKGAALTALALNVGVSRRRWWIFGEWDWFLRRRAARAVGELARAATRYDPLQVDECEDFIVARERRERERAQSGCAEVRR